jgi:uncharacterized glyoxalase superfamily protein PhnB
VLSNRSVPTNTLLAHIEYRDVSAALAYLSSTFGFIEHYRYGESDGAVAGAQVHLGDAWIMLRTAASDARSPAEAGCYRQSLTVFVEDVDSHHTRAVAAGASIVEELHETMYGERQYGAVDLDGHHWLFSTHARDVSPDEWGARVINSL